MLKVMIVEDEMLVRIGLKSSVDWTKFDMRVVADFSDGLAAWEYFERERPEIVVTDIRMPKMDGMSLIAKIRQVDKTARIVVLSALEEFDMVRKAMTLGVSNYILKITMTEEEIERVLQGISEELHELISGNGQNKSAGDIANLELIKEKMIKDFLFYGIFTPDEFGKFALRSGLRLSPARLVVCVMEVDHYAHLKEKLKDEHGHLVKLTMMNILSEIMTSRKCGEAVVIDEKRYLLLLHHQDLLSERDVRQAVHELLLHVREIVQTCFNVSVSFGVSEIRNGYGSLSGMYGEALRALEAKFFAGPGSLFMADTVIDIETLRRKLAKIRSCEPFRQMLSATEVQAFEHYVDRFAAVLTRDRKHAETMLYQLLQWIHTNLYDGSDADPSRMPDITGMMDGFDTLPEMLDFVLIHLEKLAEETRARLQMSSEVIKAIQYIKLHYKENINLQAVAEHVKLSPGYLSSLFGKELQINFVDYLNRYRVERAKELLIRTQLRSVDIAVQVGFSPEYTYFSKVFKKITGLNPNDYRRRLSEGDPVT